MAFENYTVRQFFNCLYSGGTEIADIDLVNKEFMAAAGMYDEQELYKVGYIKGLEKRTNEIKIFLELQRRFLSEFGVGHSEHFDILEKYGHNITWTNSEAFLKRLKQIENKEKKYIVELDSCLHLLKQYRENKAKKKDTGINNTDSKRGSSIRTVNSLAKIGWPISLDSTIEEYAYCIKQQTEDNERQK